MKRPNRNVWIKPILRKGTRIKQTLGNKTVDTIRRN